MLELAELCTLYMHTSSIFGFTTQYSQAGSSLQITSTDPLSWTDGYYDGYDYDDDGVRII